MKLLNIIILLCLITASALARQEISLSGQWEFRFSNNGNTPPGGEWSKINIPNHVTQREEQYVWYRRYFDVPGTMSGEKIFLKFVGVKFVCQVYINGASVGGHYGGWEPFELEITDKCKIGGENQILVRAQDFRGVVDQNLNNGSGRLFERAKDSVMAPVGSLPEEYGIWQDVSLESRKDVYIDDVFVRTSVRSKSIEVDYNLINMSDIKRSVLLESQVYDGEKLSFDLGYTQLEILPRSNKKITIKKEWTDPELWWPYSPKLYFLKSRLIENSKLVDEISSRFGFREFWTEGIYFFLNGVKIKLLATAGHPVYGWAKEDAKKLYSDIRLANCNAMRLHANIWPKTWYEAADEVGMLIIQESALWCFAQEYALSKPKFWDNMKDHLRGMIRRDKNHPSVIMYSIENEILHVGGTREKATEERLADLGKFVKSIDPTRPIMYDGDSDPGGVADVENLHYPHEFPDWYPWPNTAYWVDEKTRVGGYPYSDWQWARKKPLYMGEFLWTSFQTPDPYTMFIGDEAYHDYNRSKSRAKAMAWAMQIEAFRAAEVSGMCPWTLLESGNFPNVQFNAVKKAYEPNGAFIKEYDSRFYSRESVKRTVYLYNDILKPADLRLLWELKSEDKIVDSGKRDFKLNPADRIMSEITLRIPKVSKRTPLLLSLRVLSSGEVVFQDEKQYWAFPKKHVEVQKGAKIAVYGDVSQTPLKHIKHRKLNSLQDIKSDLDLVIIGPDSLKSIKTNIEDFIVGDRTSLSSKLSKFVNGGGTIFVMWQSSYPEGLFPANLTSYRSTVVFKRAMDSPILKDINDDDLQMWRGDNIVSSNEIAKPTSGRFRAILDSGGKDGLTYLPLVEILSGKGRYILCQLLITDKEEPIGKILLENIINYALKPSDKETKTGLVQEKMNIKNDLDFVGAITENLSGQLSQKELKDYGNIIFDGNAPELTMNLSKIREFVNNGGKVLIHGLNPDSMKKINGLFPEEIILSRTTAVPINIYQEDSAISGLTNQDLYWLGKPSASFFMPISLSTEIADYAVTKPLPQNYEIIEAEKMKIENGSVITQGDWVYIYTGATLSQKVNFPKSSDYIFAIRASGTSLEGIYPEVSIFIDGVRNSTISLEKPDWDIYTILTYIDAGEHEVSISFTNDAYNPITKEDRNLSLDKIMYSDIKFSGVKRLLTPATLIKIPYGKGFYLIDQVNWHGKTTISDKASRYLINLLVNLNVPFEERGYLNIPGAKMKPSDELKLYSVSDQIAYLATNGYIYSDVNFASEGEYTFRIKAKGTEAGGEFPNVRLMIDYDTIGDQILQGPEWEILTFKTSVKSGFHRISVVFTNDYWEPPEDRNLEIEWIRIK